jgi:hypothetical protein
MGDMLKLIWWAVIKLFQSTVSLEAEILTLRHQLRRKSPKRLAFSNFDRLVFASLYRIAPRVVNALVIVEPESCYPLASCRFSSVLAMEVVRIRTEIWAARTHSNGRGPSYRPVRETGLVAPEN